jgi:hypothetical protein
MTPELKTACEVVFQAHKASTQPIKWNSDTFRGRISLGLSDLAKETLVKKNIIVLPGKSKKMFTLLNPAVAAAANFEQAEDMIKNKKQVLVAAERDEQPVYIAQGASVFDKSTAKYSHRLLQIAGESQSTIGEVKWYMKPLFYYIIWPLCAVLVGVLITFLIDIVYTELFLHLK